MIQNLIFGILFLKILFRTYSFFTYVPMDIIGVFFYFRFSSRKSQNQQKLAKKIAHFAIRFRSKHLTYFMNLNSLDIENKILPKHTAINLSHFTNFPANIFLFGVRKKFALHHFLTPKNCILEVL